MALDVLGECWEKNIGLLQLERKTVKIVKNRWNVKFRNFNALYSYKKFCP